MFRIIVGTTLGLIVCLNAQAEAKLVSHTPTTKTSTVITVDHAKNSQMESLEPSALNDHYLNRETPTQTVSGYADVTEFDYDHCHFNESHQHHHCYEAEEHTHEETSAYTSYALADLREDITHQPVIIAATDTQHMNMLRAGMPNTQEEIVGTLLRWGW